MGIIKWIYGLCIIGFIIAAVVVISLISGGFSWILKLAIMCLAAVIIAILWMLYRGRQDKENSDGHR